MNAAIWWSLIWKEWREQRLAFWALVFTAVGLHLWALDASKPGSDHYWNPLVIMTSIAIPIGALFLGVDAASTEQAQRTAPFLSALPVGCRRVASAKLLVGVGILAFVCLFMALLTNLLLTAAYELGWRVARDDALWESLQGRVLGLAAIAAVEFLCAASLYLWVAAAAVNSESAVRAGAIGLAVLAGLWCLAFWACYLVFGDFEPKPHDGLLPLVASCIAAGLPGGAWAAATLHQDILGWGGGWLLLPFVAAHAPLVWRYVTRLGRLSDRRFGRLTDTRRAGAPATLEWLGPPRRSPRSALLWKQMRESGPLLLVGAVGAIGIATYSVVDSFQRVHQAPSSTSILESLAAGVFGGCLVMGCCVGLVAGAGALASDLDPKLFSFWRSRPVPLASWFLTVFFGGLSLLLALFGVPLLVVEWVAMERNPYPYLFVALPVLCYAAAAFMAALMRNTAYAAITASSLVGLVMGGILNVWRPVPGGLVAITVVGVSVLLTLATWTLIRKDWALRT